MKASVVILDSLVQVLVRATAPGGVEGDGIFEVRQGEEIFGLTYEALVEHGDGEIELPKKVTPISSP